jgi:hypothetical protein
MSGIGDAISQATDSSVDQPTVMMDALELPAPDGAADSSVLAAVRLRAAQLAHDNTVELDIPGYGGVLVGRYKAISIAKVYGGPGGTLRNPLTEWAVAADALSRALVGLYGRNEAGELEPLFHDQDARYDDELAAALNLEPAEHTARAVIVALLGAGDEALGQSRVWSHFLQYQSWVTEGSAQEVAADAVGEP